MTADASDQEGPAALYAASYTRLVGVLTLAAASRTEAEDVVQEAFVRLLPRWPEVGRYEDPEAWVRKVAFRLLSNRFRQLRRRMLSGPRGGEQALSPPDSARVDIARALAGLPLAQRQVIVLHYLLDLPVDAVADVQRVPVGTVKSRLARARLALAPLLEDKEIDHV